MLSPFSLLLYPRFPSSLPGPHTVGTVRSRLPKSTYVQVLYPCSDGGQRTNYFREGAVDGLAELAGMPKSIFRHLDKGPKKHPSRLEAPVRSHSNGGWPIMVFSHGTWGSSEMYTSLARSIASLGYVVVALEHEDGSACYATTSAGERVSHSLPYGTGRPDNEAFAHLLERRLSELDGSLHALSLGGPRLDASLEAVLASCDRSRFVLAGHSFGAATCALAAERLASSFPLDCCLLFDLWAGVLPAAVKTGECALPVLSVESETWSDYGWGMANLRQMGRTEESLCLRAPGTAHQSFSDSSLWTPAFVARKTGALGSRERRHALHRACAIVADSFVRQAREPATSTVLEEVGEEVKSVLETVDETAPAKEWRVGAAV